MAIKTAIRNGSWSDVSTATSPWGNSGTPTVPADGDTVYLAGYTIVVDSDTANVLAIYSGTAGTPAGSGKMQTSLASSNRTIHGSLYAGSGSTAFLDVTAGSGSYTLTVDNLIGGATMNVPCVRNTTAAAIVVTGSVTGGTQWNAAGLMVSGAGTVNVAGCLWGGVGAAAMILSGSGRVDIGGSVYGAAAGGGSGLQINTGTSPIYIAGSVYAGGLAGPGCHGITTVGTGSITIFGDVVGGGNMSHGVNASTVAALVTVRGNVTGGNMPASLGITIAGNGAGIVVDGDITAGSSYGCRAIDTTNNVDVILGGNIINTATSMAYMGKCPVWNTGGRKYESYNGTKYVQQLAASKVKKGTTHGDVVGTLSSGGAFGRFRRIDQ